MRDFNEQDDLKEIINSHQAVLIQYGSEFCTPCGSVREKIEAKFLECPEMEAIYVDIAAHPAIAAQRGIFSVPTIQVYFNGQLTIEESAYFSLEEIFEKIERYLELLD